MVVDDLLGIYKRRTFLVDLLFQLRSLPLDRLNVVRVVAQLPAPTAAQDSVLTAVELLGKHMCPAKLKHSMLGVFSQMGPTAVQSDLGLTSQAFVREDLLRVTA
jgi:hypothetical protein